MVAGDVFLLVGVFVLLIDEDEPEIRQRRENRGTRADDDAGGALADSVPFVETLTLLKIVMQHRDLFLHGGEAGFETADGLGC